MKPGKDGDDPPEKGRGFSSCSENHHSGVQPRAPVRACPPGQSSLASGLWGSEEQLRMGLDFSLIKDLSEKLEKNTKTMLYDHYHQQLNIIDILVVINVNKEMAI